jgi:septal ring factor EnvC (AmiA/AmiB activator)
MTHDKIENLVLERLKAIQVEQAAARTRDQEILSRLSGLEAGIARLVRDDAHTFAEVISDRHVVDQLKERIERIERRLELA